MEVTIGIWKVHDMTNGATMVILSPSFTYVSPIHGIILSPEYVVRQHPGLSQMVDLAT